MKSSISANSFTREVILNASVSQFNQAVQVVSPVQLVVIDSAIAAAQQLVQGRSEYADAIVLSPERDGIEQITEALQARGVVHSLHIIAHGAPGQLTLGQRRLDVEALNQYADKLGQWATHVSEAGGLLLYGCNLAEGEVGEEFLVAFQQLTKRAIAASTSKVGNPNQGGSWALDVTLGNVDARSPFLPITLEHYAGVFPELGSALEFDGVDDKVSAPDSPGLKITGSLTLETWVKIPPVNGPILRVAGKGTDYLLTIRNGGQVEFFRDSDNRVVLSQVAPGSDPTIFTVDDDQWHHIATTFDGTDIKLYIDGVLRGRALGVGGGFNTSSDAFQIGDVDPPNGPTKGLIDEVRVWNVARTEAQILAAKDGELTGTETGLVAYYNFNEGSGTTLTDRTGNGNNGTLQNMSDASWVPSFDNVGPTVDIVDVAPDPRNTAVDAITIQFSEVVQNVNLADLSLSVNGAAVDLTSATFTSTDNITWVLGNVNSLTNGNGTYALTVAVSDITDVSGNVLSAIATDSWVKQAAPVEPIDPIKPIDPGTPADPFVVVSPLSNPDLTEGTEGTTVRGRGGKDTLKGTKNNDRLLGLAGNDSLNAAAGNDFVKGGGGNDVIKGAGGDDQLLGDAGDDTLTGGGGDDLLIGGPGRDRLRGNAGADTFRFNSTQEFDDIILDYSTEDVIDLRPILSRAEFAASSKTAQLQQFIKLTQVGSNAELRIDLDGSGSGTASGLIATLNGVNLATTKVNIVV